MNSLIAAAKEFASDEDGITAIEYGLIAAVMATAVGLAFTGVSTALKAAFTTIAGKIVVT